MKIVYPLATAFGVTWFLTGSFYSLSPNGGEHWFGHTLAVSGAIIIAGLLISFAVIQRNRGVK